jgi:endonuclease/exonuclease/phosphatase family metal-dependent hydrolase
MSRHRILAAAVTATLAAALAVTVPASPGSAQAPALPEPLCGQEGTGGPTGGNAGTLRVATFNVLHTQDDEDEATLEARLPVQVQAMVDAGVEVVGLQEALNSTNHGKVAQRLAQGLAASTSQTWYWCWFQSNPHFPGEPDTQPGGGGGPLSEFMAGAVKAGETRWSEGIGILSRYPIAEKSVIRLTPRSYEAGFCVPPDPIGCNAAAFFDSRSVLRARIAAPGAPVDLYTTHLAHGLTPASDVTKLAQVLEVLAYINQTAGADTTPDFLVGDFNSLEGSPVHQAVTDAGFVDTFRAARPDDPGNTSDQHILEPNSTVDHRIDYVFGRPGSCGLRALAGEVFADEPVPYQGGSLWPSDHYAVVTTNACASNAGGGGNNLLGNTDVAGVTDAARTDQLPATGGPIPITASLAALAVAAVAATVRRLGHAYR